MSINEYHPQPEGARLGTGETKKKGQGETLALLEVRFEE